MIYVTLIYEDDLSGVVMSKMLEQFGDKFEIYNSYSGNGFGYLKKNVRSFNEACVLNPYFMLTDLDRYACPLALIDDWIDFTLNPNFIFRIAVREVEAWLLADIEGLSKFFGVSPANFPRTPDEENDPKNKIIQLARRSRQREIREDIVPLNDNASIGPNYNGKLSEFVINIWDIGRAIPRSHSLAGAYSRLADFENK